MTRCPRCFSDLLDLAVFCPQCGQPHEPDFDQLLNRSLDGHYHLYRRLGEGGMSTVFAATDTRSDQIVVVKISDPRHLVRRELTQSFDAAEARSYWAEMLERMRRKATALAAIEHPHIVRILDTNTITDELRYVVMEFLRGRTLRAEMAAQGRLDVATVKRIGLEITAGLSAIHARGIVHRDLNPRNIFLCEGEMGGQGEGGTGRGGEGARVSWSPCLPVSPSPPLPVPPSFFVKVIDFGIAKIPQPPGAPPFTQHAVMSGTVAYASPEQCRSAALDHRSDIYSLGVVLYEMATGERPFNGRTPMEIALQQLQAEPLRPRAIAPDLPSSLEALILRALAKDPQARQQSIEELAAELRTVSHRLAVPLEQAAEEAAASPLLAEPLLADEVNATPTIDAINSFRYQTDDAERAEPGARRKLILKRRRRTAMAIAGLVVLLAAAGVMLGRHLIAARRAASAPKEMTASALPAASDANPTAAVDESKPPTPTPTPNNDADALEIAASISTLEPSAAPASAAAARIASSAKAKSAPPPATKPPHPSTLPPKPQAPPASEPMIAAQRAHQPVSEPDYERGPKSEWPATTRPRETNPVRTDTEPPPMRGDEREAESHPSHPSHRGEIHPRPTPFPRPNQTEEAKAAREPSVDAEPKVISWSGTVNREREVTLELPGVPGTIDIPRSYSKRAGVIEPPGPNNSWRHVVLRVFGKGPVSIVVRWWPRVSHIVRADERR